MPRKRVPSPRVVRPTKRSQCSSTLYCDGRKKSPSGALSWRRRSLIHAARFRGSPLTSRYSAQTPRALMVSAFARSMETRAVPLRPCAPSRVARAALGLLPGEKRLRR